MSIEAMKQAIEAWDACGRYPDATSDIERLDVAINALRAAIQQAEAQQPATPESVQADSSEHLRVVASLGDALRRLSFAAQTTGGTDGPDAELQSAIGQAEQALSLGGIWQAMSATTEPVEDGIRNAEDELNCAEEVLDAITCEFSDGEFPVTDFNCIGDYITAVVDVFKERLAAQHPATGEPVDFIVSAVLIKKTPDGLFSTQNKLYTVEAASREEAHGKVLPLLGVDFPEHHLHTFCTHPVPSVLKDDQIAALVNKVRDIARMFNDHQSLRERIAIELVPALKVSQEVKSNAEPLRTEATSP